MRVVTIILMGLLLAACASGGGEGAAEAVERYHQATIEGDAETLAQVICAEREGDIEATARRFATVSGAQIDGMACTYDEATETVDCEGEIIATYGAEDTAFPLGSATVVQEGGEWKWCGEA